MGRERWQEIAQARRLLKLPEHVSMADIKDAYRRRCLDLHPDHGAAETTNHAMAELNRAYRVLMHYAEGYRIQLTPTEHGMNDEDWWMHRFGQDPIWAGDKEK